MLGAIIGDIVGSRYEFHNHRSKDFDLFSKGCFATDDSIMTLSIAKAIVECGEEGLGSQFAASRLSRYAVKYMQEIGRKYPDCGFGGMFNRWIFSSDPQPYHSFGNGAAMRVSPCGFIAKTEKEAKLLSRAVTEVTHNHKEGIKGAEAVTIAIFMARNGATLREIRERMEKDYYKLDFTLDGIRDTYQFNETCQETVPQAIQAFLESISFEDAIRNAISIGGDSDTLAAITGAIAEAYYGVPLELKRKAMTYLDTELRGIYREWERFYKKDKANRQFSLITKYIGKLDKEEERKRFRLEFILFVKWNPEYELRDYQSILEKNGLTWSREGLKSADVSGLNEQCVLAMLVGAFRADYFSNGVLDVYIQNRCVPTWLGRLKELDDQRGPEIEKPMLKQVKIRTKPSGNFQNGTTSELLVTENEVLIKNTTLDGGSVTHRYEFGMEENLAEVSLKIMAGCLESEDWHDSQLFHEIDLAVSLYELEAEFEDGQTILHRGAFDRAHMPEKAIMMFTDVIRILINAYGFGNIVELTGFMCAMKVGEVKYCGVEFSEGGKLYHYRTNDFSIDVGDNVIVPVGEDYAERKATVKTVEFRQWDDTPYPLEKTKQIIGIADEDREDTPQLLYLTSEGMEDRKKNSRATVLESIDIEENYSNFDGMEEATGIFI